MLCDWLKLYSFHKEFMISHGWICLSNCRLGMPRDASGCLGMHRDIFMLYKYDES